jgi:hypothetical protein
MELGCNIYRMPGCLATGHVLNLEESDDEGFSFSSPLADSKLQSTSVI